MARAFNGLVRLRDSLPDWAAGRLRGAKFRYTAAEVPPPSQVPDAPKRLYIGPANYAGQGFQWARSAERLPGIRAVNMQVIRRKDFGFPSDTRVPEKIVAFSRNWQRRQHAAVTGGFTHVIFESGLPLFGTLYSGDPAREVQALREHDVSIAMLSHGTDLRLPSRHREIDEWSPFRTDGWERIPLFEARALAHRRLLEEVSAPVFVATPDLLLDWPEAVWIPIVVDPEKWASQVVPLVRERPVVIHAPTNAILKGSDLIEPVVQKLHEAGVIEYRRVPSVDVSQMPGIYRDADVVLEQFRLGNYATTAIEAMAAGRVVVGHVHEQVRNHIRRTYGADVPVVQATVDTLEAVLRDIAGDRERYLPIAAAGPGFVRKIHDGAASAEVLSPFLLKPTAKT